MSVNPLISIITVCFNAEKTITATLQSVDEQTFDTYEHIIVDGASSDGTLKIINKSENALRRIVSEPDRGIYDAMNKGLGLSKGQYVMFLNAGDRFHAKDTLAHYAKAIADNREPGIVYGQTDLVDTNGRFIAKRHLSAPENLKYRDFRHGMLVCHQAMCVYNRIASLYDLKYKYSADYDWSIRCLQHSRHNVYLPEVTIDYLYEGATTAHRRSSLIERFGIMSHYYGFFPTLWRHLGFLPRFIKHRKKIKRSTPNPDQNDRI